MRLFVDTANIEEIRAAAELGIISGVTTNPSLLAREGRDMREVINEICSIVDGPISAEVVSPDALSMVAEARELAAIHANVVIKVPMCAEGLKAVGMLKREGIRTNMTLLFSANQALLAALAGASYTSVFVGRLDDIGHDGMEVVGDCVSIFAQYGLDTEIIAASIRHPQHVLASARLGTDIATVPFPVLRQMISHPLTDVGIQKFLSDWQSMKKR